MPRVASASTACAAETPEPQYAATWPPAAAAARAGASRSRRVGSEAEAERLDLDDPDYDVLAAGQHFDHLALIEDETIMAVPPTPRHQRCELPVPMPGAAAIEPAGKSGRRNPFAALAKLKNGSQNTDIIED